MDDCLVLDFAGLTYTHGFFDDPVVKRPKKTEGGEAPVKACPVCFTLCHTAVRECPKCGFKFPPPKPADLTLKIAPVMSDEAALGREMKVASWRWDIHNNGQDMLRVRYYPASYTDPIVTEYFTVWHGGAASHRAWEKLTKILGALNISKGQNEDQVYEELQIAPAPTSITYRQESRFFRVVDRQWAQSRRAF
jgi:DNA repair protein RadD